MPPGRVGIRRRMDRCRARKAQHAIPACRLVSWYLLRCCGRNPPLLQLDLDSFCANSTAGIQSQILPARLGISGSVPLLNFVRIFRYIIGLILPRRRNLAEGLVSRTRRWISERTKAAQLRTTRLAAGSSRSGEAIN